MKLGIPSMGEKGLEESIGEHFGRVPTYTLVDLDSDNVEVIPNTSHHMGGHGDPPELLRENGVEIMVCQGLGRRAIDLFQQLGITVYIGAHGRVRDAVEAFKNGELQQATMGDGCQKHQFRRQHHE
jgi:predicted Fe-Mo cluster-binding NifX family protein